MGLVYGPGEDLACGRPSLGVDTSEDDPISSFAPGDARLGLRHEVTTHHPARTLATTKLHLFEEGHEGEAAASPTRLHTATHPWSRSGVFMRRRDFLTAAVAATGAASTGLMLTGRSAQAATTGGTGLASMTAGAKPISVEERLARIAKLQRLMVDQKIGALILESGSSLDYFTGVQWHRSERTTAAVIPARGDVVVVTPAFEEPSVRETLAVGGDVRPWNEHESPFARLLGALADRGVTSGPIAFESTTRLFIVDGVREASAGAYRMVSGEALVKAVRLIKSPAELALLQTANDVTLAALRHIHGNVHPGMRPDEIAAMTNAATVALGGVPEFALVLINEASAYPHGSNQPQTVREGSVILMDVGCNVHGYQSDISR